MNSKKSHDCITDTIEKMAKLFIISMKTRCFANSKPVFLSCPRPRYLPQSGQISRAFHLANEQKIQLLRAIVRLQVPVPVHLTFGCGEKLKKNCDELEFLPVLHIPNKPLSEYFFFKPARSSCIINVFSFQHDTRTTRGQEA
jgi:hypothetical protein